MRRSTLTHDPKTGRQTARPSLPKIVTCRSLALKSLTEALDPARKHHLLDLGAATGSNVEFLGTFASRIEIEDLYSTLSSSGFFDRIGEPTEEYCFEKLMPFPASARFDIILCWDLLDYLKPEEIQALIRYLNRFCRRGTYLFVLSSTVKDIPAKPIRFKIQDQETIIYEYQTTQTLPAPRYTARDFSHMLPGFHIQGSYQLKHGMQEYLFVHE